MAQKRLRNYKNNIASFDHNIFNLGLHNPGRYCGFDSIASTGNSGNPMEFYLSHDKTGVTFKTQIDTVQGPCGILLSPQGVIIQEDNRIGPLSIDTNMGNAQNRYDLIYCTHNFVNEIGGTDATYVILKGELNSPIKPILTDPYKQTAVGIIEVPPNSNNIADCTYYKTKCPDSGDGEDARLYTPNTFKAIQGLKTSDNTYINRTDSYVAGSHTSSLWKFNNDGNTFKVLPGAGDAPVNIDGIMIDDFILQEGVRITILANERVTLREDVRYLNTDMYGKGYRPLRINPGLGNVSVGAEGGASTLGTAAQVNETWEYTFVYFQNKWFLVGIGGAGTKSSWTRGDMIFWYGDINANFDQTGLGYNLKSGWALCNGNNNTPDPRGKVLSVATNIPSLGAPDLSSEESIDNQNLDPDKYIIAAAYDTQGSKYNYISQDNLPDFVLEVDDPGHFHYAQNANSAKDSGKFTTGNDAPEGGPLRTDAATTGITVYSGGKGTAMVVVPPIWASVLIMKL